MHSDHVQYGDGSTLSSFIHTTLFPTGIYWVWFIWFVARSRWI